jgi:hypothetical protein
MTLILGIVIGIALVIVFDFLVIWVISGYPDIDD